MNSEHEQTRRGIGLWLWVVAVMTVVQVVLGGITRLTDSGLSITEWKPLLGVIPPTNEAAWAEAFAKYQQIPQYAVLKSHLDLEGFKFIYFWEWMHRLWGRLLGVAFGVPLLVLALRKRLQGLGPTLLGLFVLGGLQGVMGWVMVASGLQDLVYVSHLRLAAHFILAMVLLVALVWVGTAQLVPERGGAESLRRFTWALLGVLGLQLVLGALMAGLKAALAAPTWPSINGLWLPVLEWPWWNDPLAIHLFHRGVAYLLTAGVLGWWWRTRGVLGRVRHVVLGLVALQVLLGIAVTVRSVVPGELLRIGVAHQLVATLLVMALTVALVRLSPARKAVAEVSEEMNPGLARSGSRL